jgi:ABC-type multidrug transport system fused ATPase/permease subunit
MKMKKKADKSKMYPMWDNCLYAFRHLKQKEGAAALAVCGGDVGFSVLLPFLETALAGAVAAILVSGRQPGEILLLVSGYVALLQTVRFLQGYLKNKQSKTLFMLRIDMMMDYFGKTVWMDGQSLESARGQKKWQDARRNLCWGNSLGIEAYAKAWCDTLLQVTGLILCGAIVGQVSLLLLVILILQTLLVSWLHAKAGKQAYSKEDEIEKKWDTFQYLRRETVAPGNGKDIRMYRMDKWFLWLFRQLIDGTCALIDRQQTGYMAAGMAENLLTFARSVAVYGWLIREMAAGNMTLPSFLSYVGIVAGFSGWMNGIFQAWQQILENEKAMDAYRDFMDFGVVEEGKQAPERPGCAHEIRFEHVCFRYDGSNGPDGEDTIRDLNLTIRPGERLALVGLNGAGKTTLIKLLCGLYRPTSGAVYLDGKNIQSLDQRAVFREFAVVFQDVFAFSFPLSDNVSCVDSGREDPVRLRESLEKAGLWERVCALPKQVQTAMNKELDEDGVILSGGEMQKLMLARALYKGAPVVILDEPTAALDPIAESEMYEKYDELVQGGTAVFISHRLSSTRFCDRILFLEKGRITEEGTHEELMRRGGAYAELFALQAKYYREKSAWNIKGEQYA